MTSVLVVDDDGDIRRLFRASLAEDFDVREATNGMSALALIRELRPDIVLLDVTMPGGLNGLEVLTEIREDPDICHTTVMMVTGRGEDRDFANAQKHGADGYIVKPFSPQEVRKMLMSRLQKSA
jgi:CheY-like chemotaxis protein